MIFLLSEYKKISSVSWALSRQRSFPVLWIIWFLKGFLYLGDDMKN